MSTLDYFTEPQVLVIFTYAPAGLGHLRVTDALYEALPAEARTRLLGAEANFVGKLHQLTSTTPWGKQLLEWTQYGWPQAFLTAGYRRQLRKPNRKLYRQLVQTIGDQMEVVRQVVVVATHFGLAHQIAALKEKLSMQLGVKITLVVQVTDDSPQSIWYIPGADLICAPSLTTKKGLLAYGKQARLPKVTMQVLPYPVSRMLAKNMTDKEQQERKKQLDGTKTGVVRVVAPVSGAAVGLSFLSDIATKLRDRSSRYEIELIAQESLLTQDFLTRMRRRSYVHVHSSPHNREVVNLYQQALIERVCALELTKPSEQAFKALLSPRQRGGVILLLTYPVGRQEYDNLSFLERHWLIPSRSEHDQLTALWHSQQTIPSALLKRAEHWRGLRIPDSPGDAAHYIDWCLSKGLFSTMLAAKALPEQFDDHKHELSDEGVTLFWEEVKKVVGDE